MRLQGKVACISGAGQDIGRAIALRFAQEGAIVLLNETGKADELAHLVDEIRAIGHLVGAIEGDVASEKEVKRMVEGVLQTYSHIDIWVNAAAAATTARSGEAGDHEYSEEERFRRLLDVDVKGTFICCNVIAPIMQTQASGCIINMSWDAALAEGAAGTDSIMYAAAKGAVHGLSMSLAREFAPAVRVNVIAPGSMHANGAYPIVAEHKSPLERLCTADDVADAALYLASPEASYITGQTLVVNGGGIMY
jgi:3-oxoacyl-[acyl-carrier protein] reductase